MKQKGDHSSMPVMPSGKFRTNLTLSLHTHQWLREHSTGEKGMGELVDQLVLKERLFRAIENRLAILEALVQRQAR
jgi:hypothetical protein